MRQPLKKQTKLTSFLLWIGLGGVLTLLYFLLNGGTKSPNRGAKPKEIANWLLKTLQQGGVSPMQIKLIMGQAWHETGGYTSTLAQEYNNIFGITNHVTGNGDKTESGFMNYKDFNGCLEDYFSILIDYMNRSQKQFPDTFIGFGTWLRENGYYTDTVTNYTNGMINGWSQTAKLLNIDNL